ncbi:MAG TPA: nitroreductase [Brevundimonas sp.]|nr:nitroreductase [Brevundimonas sp.]
MSEDALPLPVPSAELRTRLATRRSTPAQALAAPGPSADQIADILRIGARTPDHGKLFPWRFVVLGPKTRADIAARLEPMAERRPDPKKARAVLAKLVNPPVTILVISTPTLGHKVPVWEQELSAGAVCMNLSHAANALGFATNWITDWYAYEAPEMFGVGEGEKIAGFIHIGAAAEPPLERPRPDMTERVTTLP